MAKARVVVGDTNSAEIDALKRSFNSLLVVLERVCNEVEATTLTPLQGFVALNAALRTGRDASAPSGAAAHVGTNRLIPGVKSTPQIPPRSEESAAALVDMAVADKY